MLYAWVRPLESDPKADHTWITSYPAEKAKTYPDVDAVRKAGESYWYCAGGYCATGASNTYADGMISVAPRNDEAARAVMPPNDPQAQVLQYGIQGICHQIANRVLASAGRAAATVELARRYWISNFAWGTYGRGLPEVKLVPEGFQPPVDDFERHFYDMLGRYAALAPLRELRTSLGEAITAAGQEARSGAGEVAKRVNALINDHLRQAGRVLDPEEYERIFGERPGVDVQLVDPAGIKA